MANIAAVNVKILKKCTKSIEMYISRIYLYLWLHITESPIFREIFFSFFLNGSIYPEV